MVIRWAGSGISLLGFLCRFSLMVTVGTYANYYSFPHFSVFISAAAKSLQSCPTLATPWTAAHQAPRSMGFSRQEYWSGVPLPSPVFMWV